MPNKKHTSNFISGLKKESVMCLQQNNVNILLYIMACFSGNYFLRYFSGKK